MSWSKSLLRNGFSAIALISAASLSACTMAPVYSNPQGVAEELAFSYAEPNSRLEQIVYQELRLRFGRSNAPDARQVRVAVSASSGLEALSKSAGPNDLYLLTATARLTIAPPEASSERPVTITRTATANYTTSAQAFAAAQARIDAEERAARAVAESLRIALLAGAAR